MSDTQPQGKALLICGDRHWKDRKAIVNQVLRYYHSPYGLEVIIQGMAPGADSLAGSVAREYYIPQLAIPARWDQYGRAAGPMRNKVMLTQLLFYDDPLVLAFHDDLPNSKGTANMVRIARQAKVPVRLIRHRKAQS